MRQAAVLVGAALIVAGCSDADRPGVSSTTTVALAPGVMDCNKIRAGDELGSDSIGMVCDPADKARLFTVDCIDGVYFLLRRPEDDLEGITGRTAWQKAGEESRERGGRTPFAFDECKEHD